MVVKLCPCWEYSCRRGTIFACVWKSPREMDILNMFPQVSPIIASFSTEGTSVSPWTTLGRLLYIVVKLLVPCKEQAWKSLWTLEWNVFQVNETFTIPNLPIHVPLVRNFQKALKLLCAAVTWWLSLVRVPKIEGQYLHSYEKTPLKWAFSTCFLRLLLSFPVFPHIVHLLQCGPPTGSFTIYSYSCLSSMPASMTL